MKILWIMDDVMPDYCEEFGIRKFDKQGWIVGLLNYIEKCSKHDIAFCFPLRDSFRIHNGNKNGHRYYGFQMIMDGVYSTEQEDNLLEIVKDYKPDIVHIWGTEFVHSLAMHRACNRYGIADKVIINIQGLVYTCSKHYCEGLPQDYLLKIEEDKTTILSGKINFQERGVFEKELLAQARYVIGRTDWDKACVTQINPKIQYFHIGEIMRDAFYENIGSWDVNKCMRHNIFISQGSYPVKGLHYFLEALPIILAQYPDTTVTVSGNSPLESKNYYGNYILHLLESKGLKDKVLFLGKQSVDEMLRLFKNANVFVSASVIENSPNSVNEAMMIGTPVVSSYVGGVMDVITHGESGYLYQTSAPYMLAFYVMKLFENDEICMKFSAQGVEAIKQVVDKKINGEGTLKVYNSIKWGI